MKLMKRFKQSDVLLLIICFVLMISAGLVNQSFKRPNISVTKQDSAINFNNYFLLFFSAGNKRLLADLFWVSTLIESDIDHYKQKDLNSWMYLRFKTINTLDPKYLRAYQFGGKYLSIVKDDLLGAEKIFKAGLKIYPLDYFLNFDLAFLYTFELAEINKGIKYFEIIKNHPKSPRFLPSLILKLKYQQSPDLEMAFKALMVEYQQTTDPLIKSKFESDLYAIKAQIDLECLNKKIETNNCNKKDFYGDAYVFKSSKWQTTKEYKEYKFYSKK